MIRTFLSGCAPSAVTIAELFDKFSKKGDTGLKPLLSRGANALQSALSESGVSLLPLTFAHSAALRDLPVHHRDPFDRMLIAQAIAEDLELGSHDAAFSRYPSLALLKA
ncbi:MAG: type II toxin-antitoxin system VapC family toxin [Parvularculaceae bacterium]